MIVEKNLAKTPKISIIITYYNLGDYIEKCIKSIFEQTYNNFEIIIVNDGSDSKNSLVLENILKNFNSEKIKIFNLKENTGQLGAFLAGLKKADGEFISMVDADDILLPNYLKTLLYIHLNYNTAFVSSSCGEINEKDEIITLNYVTNKFKNSSVSFKFDEMEKMFNPKNEFEIEVLDIQKLCFGEWGWNPSSSAMIRKSALKILEYYPDIKYWKTGADKVIFSLLHLIGGSINTNAVLWLYRHHGSNNSKTNNTIGNKKYLREEYVKKIIGWNIKLRIDTLKMFIKNKKEFIEIFNKTNYYKMLSRIIFCLNIKLCVKIIETFTHRII